MNNKVLVVEDEEFLLKTYKSYLERKGYEVFITPKGETGIALLKEHDPDFMILDLSLGEGIQGIDVLKESIKIKPALKVIVSTGFGKDDDVIDMCTKQGAKCVFKKPLQLDVLRQELEKMKEAG